MFQWPPNENAKVGLEKSHYFDVFPPESQGTRIRVRKYPMKALGGKSTPSMTDLRDFVKVIKHSNLDAKVFLQSFN